MAKEAKRKKRAAAEVVELPTKKAPGPKTVVDVPKSAASDARVDEFVATHGPWVRSYLEKQFDGVDDAIVGRFAREVAECKVLSRTPVDGEEWEATDVEEAIKAFDAENPAPKAEKKAKKPKPKPEPKPEPEEAPKAATPKAEKKAKPAPVEEDRVTSLAAVESIGGSIVAAWSDGTISIALADNKEIARIPENVAKYLIPVVEKAAAGTKAVNVKPSKTKEDDLGFVGKGVEGLEVPSGRGKTRFAEAVDILRRNERITMTTKDQPAAVDLMWDVVTGKAELPKEGKTFASSKSYGPNRLRNIIKLAQELAGSDVGP